jgi:hypothetical protein
MRVCICRPLVRKTFINRVLCILPVCTSSTRTFLRSRRSVFSVAQHVQRLTASSAQTIYALRVLHNRGLSNEVLQHVYRSTVVARLIYAVSAWRGLTKASNRQRINSVIDRARRQGYCSIDLPSFDELCDVVDDE